MVIGRLMQLAVWAYSSQALLSSDSDGMGNHISMSLSGDSLLNETLNRGPRRYSCGDNMNFPLGLIQSNFHFHYSKINIMF